MKKREMTLRVLSELDCELIRTWRNKQMCHLRTSFLISEGMQKEFYQNVVCNRHSTSRYWGIHEDKLVGIGGLTDIQHENGIAEITVILCPNLLRKGYGTNTVDLLLEQAFDYMGLRTVFGECYYSNPASKFWEKVASKYSGYVTTLPDRKFWQGRWWDSLYFSINKDKFNASR